MELIAGERGEIEQREEGRVATRDTTGQIAEVPASVIRERSHERLTAGRKEPRT